MMDFERFAAKGRSPGVEKWVNRAKLFGEESRAIHQNADWTLDQKLEKQKKLGAKLIKEIQEDVELEDEEKAMMLRSVQRYLDDGQKIHEVLKETLPE